MCTLTPLTLPATHRPDASPVRDPADCHYPSDNATEDEGSAIRPVTGAHRRILVSAVAVGALMLSAVNYRGVGGGGKGTQGVRLDSEMATIQANGGWGGDFPGEFWTHIYVRTCTRINTHVLVSSGVPEVQNLDDY